MPNSLISKREEVMDMVDRALDAAWPHRTGNVYVGEMQTAENQLLQIAAIMQERNIETVEQSRTYRYLGSVYSDLSPALGKDMLLKAKDAYLQAERLLEGYDDIAEKAKLNFNFAITLRQIDPNDSELLNDAKRRVVDASKYFEKYAPEHMSSVNTTLSSINDLLKVAPLAKKSEQINSKLEPAGNNEMVSVEQFQGFQDTIDKEGGMAGLVGQLHGLVNKLSPKYKNHEKMPEIMNGLKDINKPALGGGSEHSEEMQLLEMLKDRLQKEIQTGKVDDNKSKALKALIDKMERALSGNGESKEDLIEVADDLRKLATNRFEMLHYFSHGLDRPPKGSRAAELVEMWWELRQYLIQEMARPEKGMYESKETQKLNEQAGKADRRIYEAGSNNNNAVQVDQYELRPIALKARTYSARNTPMMVTPEWPVSNPPVDITSVFFSGSQKLRTLLDGICKSKGLALTQQPTGRSFANSRWKQLQGAMCTVFDFTVRSKVKLTAIAYELGIALTIGKPVMICAKEGQTLPFDIEINPVFLKNDKNDLTIISSAIDNCLIWTYPQTTGKPYLRTVEYALSKYPRPQKNTYVDQTIRSLMEARDKPDAISVNRNLDKLVEYVNDGRTMITHPLFPPVYPENDNLRMFHVMPFGPDWADEVREQVRNICSNLNVEYIRGDEADDPNIINSIWVEIAKASHILVDLTGFNANVALEMGMAHTLGKKTLIVGQKKTVEKLFPMIAKQRFSTYKNVEDHISFVTKFVEGN